MNGLKSAVGILSIAMAMHVSAARGSSPADTTRVVNLDEVEVLSTRATRTTPIAFKNLDRQDINAANYGLDLPYLLSSTPSATISSDAGNGIGYTSLRIRGTDPTRINITANGVPMNDSESAMLYWVNIGDFASSLSSIQIQRGVGTSTNGAGAFGASVNMATEPISKDPYFSLDLSGGSYYSHKETMRFSTGLLHGHWGLQGRLSNIGSKGYLDRASTKLNSYFLQAGYFDDNTSVRLITWNGQEETYHAWNYASKYEQSLYGRRYNSCGEYYDSDGTVHYYKDQTDNYHINTYQLLWNQILSPEWNFNVTLHYTRGEGYYNQYKSGRYLAEYGLSDSWDDKSDLIRRKNHSSDYYGVVASLNYDNKKRLTANIGGGWDKYNKNHFGTVMWVREGAMDLQPEQRYYDNNAKKTDFNIYGKMDYAFTKKAHGYLDLQYRHIDYKMQDPSDWYISDFSKEYVLDDNFDFFNPKFGLHYDINRYHKVYVSFGSGHKEPTRNDYQDNWGTPLKAEWMLDEEYGYRYTSRRFSAGINVYGMGYHDQFVLTGKLNDVGEMIASNVGKSYRVGIELDAAWKPLDWLKWEANATFSRNRSMDMMVELDDGTSCNIGNTPISFTPEVIFNNIITFNYKGLRASLQSQYVGEQYLTNTGFKSYTTTDDNGKTVDVSMMLDDFFTTNADISYTIHPRIKGLKGMTVGLTAYNLFSAKYDTNGWAAPNYKLEGGKVVAYTDGDLYEAGFAPQAPFNVMARLSLDF